MARRLLWPWERLTQPHYTGLENIPREGGALFVSNHTFLGVIDSPFVFFAIYQQTGRFVRSLGDHFHFYLPGWRDLLVHFGVVEGTRENTRRLMQMQQPILVYPGGGREVFKQKGEKYTLLWKQRMGFARLAVEFGYPIVPVAAVGAEECYRIHFDSNDYRNTWWGELFLRFNPRTDFLPVLFTGLGGTPLPIPQRFFFSFGAPISTAHLRGRHEEKEVVFAVREQTRHALQEEIDRLLQLRAASLAP